MVKKCNRCNNILDISMFRKEKLGINGLRSLCKDCDKKTKQERGRTMKGVIYCTYDNQVSNSKRRKHSIPLYSKKELYDYLINNNLFIDIYNKWVLSGYEKNNKPSIDRIDDYRGYSFDNIVITTWEKNNSKYKDDLASGKNTKVCKSVKRICIKTGEVVIYHSVSDAKRKNINDVEYGLKVNKPVMGYLWEYVQ